MLWIVLSADAVSYTHLSDYVRDIAEHPEKTYTTRLRNKGKIYDFAAVARQDAAGIVITYMQKEEVSE